MSATKPHDLATSVAVVYVMNVHPLATVPKILPDQSNLDAVYSALKTEYPFASFKKLASTKGVQISETPDANNQQITVDDGNALIYDVSIPESKITTSWYESRNTDVREILLGKQAVTITETLVDFELSATVKEPTVNAHLVVLILATRPDGKIEEYYLVDGRVTGDIVTSFLKYKEPPVGSDLSFVTNDGGYIIRKMPKL